MRYLVIVLIIVMIIVALLAAWRMVTQRSKGTPVILRRLPASGTHGWRHGVFRYKGNAIEYYKLRSLSPFADLVLQRRDVIITGHRDLSDLEASFLSASPKLLQFQHHGVDYEICFSTRSEMAFTAWVEAAPDARTDRLSAKELQRRASRHPKQ